MDEWFNLSSTYKVFCCLREHNFTLTSTELLELTSSQCHPYTMKIGGGHRLVEISSCLLGLLHSRHWRVRRSSGVQVSLLLIVLLWSGAMSAAELRGRIWNSNNSNQAPANATLHVTCPNFSQNSVLAEAGHYSIRNLPSKATCVVMVSVGDKQSKEVEIRTNAPVVRFNAEVRSISDRVLLLPRK